MNQKAREFQRRINASHVVQDGELRSPESWRRDLVAAGWIEERMTVWRDPEGNLWRGPYGAWRELQRRTKA